MPRRRSAIELLRFVLALSVVVYHYFYFGPCIGSVPDAPVTVIAPFLLLAVETFFIISGFVIMFSAAERSASEFAVARFARLGPTLFVCATLTYLILGMFPLNGVRASFDEWLASVLVLPLAVHNGADPSLWSLKYEIVFYALVVVLLSTGLSTLRIIWLAWGLVASDLLYAAIYFSSGSGGLTWWPMGHYGAFFALGMLYYLSTAGAGWPKWLWAAALATALVDCRVELLRVEGQLLSHQAPGLVASTLAGAAVIGAFFGFAKCVEIPGLARLFARLGSASYPLYVIHQFLGYRIITWVEQATAIDPVIVKLGVAALMVLFAWAFAAVIENRLMNQYRSYGGWMARIARPAAAG